MRAEHDIRVPSALVADERLTWTERGIWIAARSRQGINRSCTASIATLARDAGVGYSTAKSAVKKLIKLGWMKRQGRELICLTDGPESGHNGLKSGHYGPENSPKGLNISPKRLKSGPLEEGATGQNLAGMGQNLAPDGPKSGPKNQNKPKIKTKRGEGEEEYHHSPSISVVSSGAVRVYRQFCERVGYEPSDYQLELVAGRVPDDHVDVWQKTLERWFGSGWKAGNVPGLLDAFRKALAEATPAATPSLPQPEQPRAWPERGIVDIEYVLDFIGYLNDEVELEEAFEPIDAEAFRRTQNPLHTLWKVRRTYWQRYQSWLTSRNSVKNGLPRNLSELFASRRSNSASITTPPRN